MDPTHQDWIKLMQMMLFFLWDAKDEVLTLSSNGKYLIKLYLDDAFAVLEDMKSHTGATMTLGEGCIQSISMKQKLDTRSSTKAE